jgi:hypothetical protein
MTATLLPSLDAIGNHFMPGSHFQGVYQSSPHTPSADGRVPVAAYPIGLSACGLLSGPFIVLAWLSLMMAMAGCGGNAPTNLPDLMAVSGTVTFDNKPLSGVTVTFIPMGGTRGTGATGYTDKDGKYELSAIHRGKGTPVGEYRVTASKWVMPDDSDFPVSSKVSPYDSNARDFLSSKYTHRDQTILKATVHDGPNTIDFPLTSKP